MRFIWYDYDKEYSSIIDGWLDADAIRFTSCDDGWDSFYEYWKNDDEMLLCQNYWSKLIYENGSPIGVIAVSLYENDFLIMEFIIAPSKRGKGYGSAALKELLDNGTAIIGKPINQAQAVIYPDNIASQKAFEKVGFSFDHAHTDGDAWYYIYKR